MAFVSDSSCCCCVFKAKSYQIHPLPQTNVASTVATAILKEASVPQHPVDKPSASSSLVVATTTPVTATATPAVSKPKVLIMDRAEAQIQIQEVLLLQPILSCGNLEYLQAEFKEGNELINRLALYRVFDKPNTIRLIFNQNLKIIAISNSVLEHTGFTSKEILSYGNLDKLIPLDSLVPSTSLVMTHQSDAKIISSILDHAITVSPNRTFIKQTFLHLNAQFNHSQIDLKSLKAHIYILKSEPFFVALIHKINTSTFEYFLEMQTFNNLLHFSESDSAIDEYSGVYCLRSEYHDRMRGKAFRSVVLTLKNYTHNPETTMVLICDKNLQLLAITKSVISITGFKQDRIIAHPLSEFIPNLTTEDTDYITANPPLINGITSPQCYTITKPFLSCLHVPSPTLKFSMSWSASPRDPSISITSNSLSPSKNSILQGHLNVKITIYPKIGYTILLIEPIYSPTSHVTPLHTFQEALAFSIPLISASAKESASTNLYLSPQSTARPPSPKMVGRRLLDSKRDFNPIPAPILSIMQKRTTQPTRVPAPLSKFSFQEVLHQPFRASCPNPITAPLPNTAAASATKVRQVAHSARQWHEKFKSFQKKLTPLNTHLPISIDRCRALSKFNLDGNAQLQTPNYKINIC